MRRLSPLLAWLLAAASVLPAGACGLFDGDRAPPSTSGSVTTATSAVPRPASEVLDTGGAPRKRLRLHFAEGDTTTVTLTLDLDVTQERSGSEQVLDSPQVRETVRFRVDRVDGTGADVSFRFLAATVDRSGTNLTGREELEIAADLQDLVGLGGRGRVTDSGTFASFRYDRPDDLAPSVASILHQFEGQVANLTLPLPAEPVGIGARWRTTATATLAGIAVAQVTTYEITGLTDSGVSYRTTSRQTAADQPIEPATLPPGTRARLVSTVVSGTGTGTMDLDSLAASSSSALSGTQVVELTRNRLRPERLTQRIGISLTVAAAP